MTQLEINGQAVQADQLHRFALRWQGDKPALYYDGRRVTEAWRIRMAADIPEDKWGASA